MSFFLSRYLMPIQRNRRLAPLSAAACALLLLHACGGASDPAVDATIDSQPSFETSARRISTADAARDVADEALSEAEHHLLLGMTADEQRTALEVVGDDASTLLSSASGVLVSIGTEPDTQAPEAIVAASTASILAAVEAESTGAGEQNAGAAAALPLPTTANVPQVLAELRAASALLTRFDAGEAMQLTTSGQSLRFDGLNQLKSPENAVDIKSLSIQLGGGDGSERRARLVPDPDRASNKLLHFWLRSANVRDDNGEPYKGRVQFNSYGTEEVGAKEVRFSARMFISSDMNLLRNMRNSFGWMAISEWWNNAPWTGEKFPFRITVNVAKPSTDAGSSLHFSVVAQSQNVDSGVWNSAIWRATNTQIQVPVGQWVTIEYFFHEGNASTGRFYMAMVPDGGTRKVLFDVKGWTRHPSDPAPDGIKHINPMKLYTSKILIDNVRKAGGILQMYWDDIYFQLCPVSCASTL